ncbi:hypothetical protein EEB12_28670 [Rhodococcus sp. WS1]|nr:hypothetical protein EEB12_28670 [Rhodococcus sp. WS1]TQC34348.1 hypothetical protein EEB16_29645 [Rhodococcus sp. WS7]
MSKDLKLIARMRDSPQNVTYKELLNFCRKHFGPPRTSGSSHAVFSMPWSGDPRVNIQDKKGKAKPYQVDQVVAAYDKLTKEEDNG